MGVYIEVSMCVEAGGPLAVDTRIAIVDLAIREALITRDCAVKVPAVLPPRGVVQRVKHLFGVRTMYARTVESGAPGPWIADRLRSIDGTSDYEITSGFPMWKAEALAGAFSYRASRTARPVKIFNAYRSEESRSGPPDGVIGSFFDVLTLDAKSGIDSARVVASSRFVRELKSLTGTKVTCRASWY